MLSNKGFDLWADGYDKSVGLSDEDNSYPFAGYKKVLGAIYNSIRENGAKSVLDIGFGTGVLTSRLYADGCKITGVDFSERMIEIAQAKMPDARLICHDFSRGLPVELAEEKFDAITCTYAIHHLTDAAKAEFIGELLEHLTEGGLLLLGDVAFETRAELDACREASGDDWDGDEIYIVAEEMRAYFPQVQFEKFSHCAGVLTLKK